MARPFQFLARFSLQLLLGVAAFVTAPAHAEQIITIGFVNPQTARVRHQTAVLGVFRPPTLLESTT